MIKIITAKVLHGCVSGMPFSRRYRLHFSWHGSNNIISIIPFLVQPCCVKVEGNDDWTLLCQGRLDWWLNFAVSSFNI
jgi:hypothetical protein